MIDKLILRKAELISYSQSEISNIASSSNHLRKIINNQIDFRSSFIGGSYKRNTMVKTISDVDIYYEYVGNGNPQTALVRLKNCLTTSYPTSVIKQDKPSILVDFNRIPFNITPCKLDWNNNVSIPDNWLTNWRIVEFKKLERKITNLRAKNSNYIYLIKVLKLWNKSHNKRMKNFDIEEKVCNLFLNQFTASSNSFSDWMWTFFQNNGFLNDARKIHSLMLNNSSEFYLKSEWLKFIENK